MVLGLLALVFPAHADSSARLEDSLYLGKGQLAESNAQQVAKIKRILGELSLETASSDEAREMLALKGIEQVGF